jgi:hypothetical protein
VSDMKGRVATVSKTITVTDPIDTWTQSNVGTTGSQRAAVWGKGRFVVAEFFGAVATSWDGITWTSSGELPAFDWEPVLAFGNNVFVAGGKKDGVAEAQLCYSVDGRFWSQATFPVGIPQVYAVAFGAGKFLALANDGNVLSSTNGITWTLRADIWSGTFPHG